MTTRNDTVIETMFHRFDQFDWTYAQVSLEETQRELQKFGDTLPDAVANFVESLQQTNRNPDALISHDLITRTDYRLYRSRKGDFECWLHLGREAIKPKSAIRPHINAKGYWLATTLLRGSLSVQFYRYDGIGDSTWFRHEYLRRDDPQTLNQPGQSIVLGPDRIHRLVEVAEGTITLTIRVLRGAQPYRDYIRMMDHFTVITREPRANRQSLLVAHLRKK